MLGICWRGMLRVTNSSVLDMWSLGPVCYFLGPCPFPGPLDLKSFLGSLQRLMGVVVVLVKQQVVLSFSGAYM